MYAFMALLLVKCVALTNINLVSFLWSIGKQYSPKYDATERGVPSGAILFCLEKFHRDKLKNLK